jgi:hypothetical protein
VTSVIAWCDRTVIVRLRQHPILGAALVSLVFGTGVGLNQGIREGYFLAWTLLTVGLLTCGMFAFLMLAGSYLVVVRSGAPLAGVPRRLTDATVIACIAAFVALAFRNSLWWVVETNANDAEDGQWRTNGDIRAYSRATFPATSQNYSPAPGKPGLYRITIEQDDGIPLIYIGESEFLPQRLSGYIRFLHEKNPEGTSARLAAEIRAAACAERQVSADVATTGKMMLRGEETDLRMAVKAQRILAEAAAVLDEQWKHDTRAYVLDKALDDGRRWIGPAHPLDEPVPRPADRNPPLAWRAKSRASGRLA